MVVTGGDPDGGNDGGTKWRYVVTVVLMGDSCEGDGNGGGTSGNM